MEQNGKVNLLNHKYDVLLEICKITKDVDLTNKENIADNYVNMVENRGQLMLQLEELDKLLEGVPKNGEPSAQEAELRTRNDELINEIVSTDKSLREEVDSFLSSIKENIAQIRKTKDVKKHYEYDLYLSDSAGKGFDRSN